MLKYAKNVKVSILQANSIRYIDSTDNFSIRSQIWNHFVDMFGNYNFWTSNDKFILKFEIVSPDADRLCYRCCCLE